MIVSHEVNTNMPVGQGKKSGFTFFEVEKSHFRSKLEGKFDAYASIVCLRNHMRPSLTLTFGKKLLPEGVECLYKLGIQSV